jgi:DNA-directed RNA polymerase II subunit RPB1
MTIDNITITNHVTEEKKYSLSSKPDDINLSRKDRLELLTSTSEKQDMLPLLMITKSVISVFSWDEMQKIAGPIRITNSDLSGVGSVNDPRMGGVSVRLPVKCSYCKQIDCTGHYGLIEFSRPIYNPMFIRDVVSILTCVCNDCGGLLITEDIIRQKGWHLLPTDKRSAEIEEYCKEVNKCLRHNPQIGNGFILPCDSNPVFMIKDLRDKGEITFKRPENGSKKVNKDDKIYPMTITTVINILNRISDEDARLIGFSIGSHPRNLIMYGCLVIPTIARPPLYEGNVRREDKLTRMYVGIVKKVEAIKSGKNPLGKNFVNELYTIMKELIYKNENNNNSVGIKEFQSIIERIQGKEALIRGLSMGKRGNYCGRTVAGPDSSLEFGQIRLPSVWAQLLTKRITVAKFNIKYLQDLFDKGQVEYKISSKTGLREYIANRPSYKLKIGDIVERWLQNNDRVIINRQPTLHRQSKMGYRVVLGKELTIGLHLSYTTPMNCDFDGDENNAWLPRHFEVEAETEILLNVKSNIMSSEHNRPVMGLVMNSITSVYLMTKQNNFISPALFDELSKLITNVNSKKYSESINERLIKWGISKNSGNAIFSLMLPPNFYYNQKGILIINGILISGKLKKSSIGASHRSIIQDLYKKYGSSLTSEFFTNASWILNKWLMERGFSVGLLDMINLYLDKDNKEVDRNTEVLKTELANIYNKLETLAIKLDDPIEESFRQKQITNLSNVTTGIGIKLADDALTPDNSIAVMTEKGAGTKGAVANIGQMMGAVGQQFLYSKRILPSITNKKRTLPTFEENDTNPEAYGFIPTSFFTGLNPESLFFLQAGGRPSLLDTALKTQDTGSMQHKMTKAFENIVISYDGSVRNAIGTLFSPLYNSGYDVAEMMMVDNQYSIEFSSFIDIKSLAEELNIESGWIPKDVNEKILTQRTKIYPTYDISDEIFDDIKKEDDLNTHKVDEINDQHIYSITKFEKSRLIGARAIQLADGAKPIINIVPGVDVDPIDIALKEYDTGKLNIYIVRKATDRTFQKIYPTKENQLY